MPKRFINDLRSYRVTFPFVLLIIPIMIVSCSKEQVTTRGFSRRYLVAYTILEEWKKGDIYIESFDQKDVRYEFTLSNNESFWFYKDSISVLKIGLDGFLYHDGDKTVIQTSSSEMQNEIKQYQPRSATGDDLVVIIEDYTKWIFFFRNGRSISIGKSLFSYNPDSILRGINHRGYNIIAPENTLPAFRLSRLQGFTHVETDVRFTSDGIPVLVHDESIERISNGTGKINQMTYSELSSYDYGSWKSPEFKGTTIPTLDEFLELCQQIGLEPYIELKAGTRDQVIDIVKKVKSRGLDGKVTYISFGKRQLEYVMEEDVSASVGFLCWDVTQDAVSFTLSLKNNDNFVFLNAYDYSDRAIALCMENDLPLQLWTIDSKDIMLSLNPYISGVTSNCYHVGRLYHDAKN